MKENRDGVTVTILGKEFMVAFPEDERAALVAAAGYLDKKMREIQSTGKVIGTVVAWPLTPCRKSNSSRPR